MAMIAITTSSSISVNALRCRISLVSFLSQFSRRLGLRPDPVHELDAAPFDIPALRGISRISEERPLDRSGPGASRIDMPGELGVSVRKHDVPAGVIDIAVVKDVVVLHQLKVRRM